MKEIRKPIGAEQIRAAQEILRRYRQGKAALENRIVENEQWYRLRHGDAVGERKQGEPEAVSAWLFNSIANKHADAMDQFPEPVILPREAGDEETASVLSGIIPVILERNDFEETYSDAWWYKLKQGTAVYGVFWNQEHDPAGDVEICRVDLLNLFWEPGICDIQDSRNLFCVRYFPNEELLNRYPQLQGKLGTRPDAEVRRYPYEDRTDDTDRTAVVDWYYKLRDDTGKIRLHYCKFVGDELLFASQNEEIWAERGFYDHGQYPFVFDRLYYAEGSPAGFGCIDVMKSPQLYIDKLNQVLLKNALQSARKRYFIRDDGSVSEKEFADFSRELIHVTGNLGEDSIRELRTAELPSGVLTLLSMKIDELKETSGNRDFSQGGTASGVTAASAIAALQEAGNKLTRDMLKSSYRSFVRVCRMVIELIRQFYTEPRIFRLVGDENADYITFSGQDLGEDSVFDVRVRAQKATSFARLTQNETVLELYRLGFFAPDRSDQALVALEAMEFEGREKIIRSLQTAQTLSRENARYRQELLKLAQVVDIQNGSHVSQAMQEEGIR